MTSHRPEKHQRQVSVVTASQLCATLSGVARHACGQVDTHIGESGTPNEANTRENGSTRQVGTLPETNLIGANRHVHLSAKNRRIG